MKEIYKIIYQEGPDSLVSYVDSLSLVDFYLKTYGTIIITSLDLYLSVTELKK